MRDMYNLYAKRSTSELNQLRSKKWLRITKLELCNRGWFDNKELEALTGQVRAIDAEIARRKAQSRLF